jgi:hypothetical protein
VYVMEAGFRGGARTGELDPTHAMRLHEWGTRAEGLQLTGIREVAGAD